MSFFFFKQKNVYFFRNNIHRLLFFDHFHRYLTKNIVRNTHSLILSNTFFPSILLLLSLTEQLLRVVDELLSHQTSSLGGGLGKHLAEHLAEHLVEPVVELLLQRLLLQAGVLLDVDIAEFPKLLVVEFLSLRSLLFELQTGDKSLLFVFLVFQVLFGFLWLGSQITQFRKLLLIFVLTKKLNIKNLI